MARHARISRRSGAIAGAVAGVVVAVAIAALLILRAAGLGQSHSYAVPAHWHDVSPPANGPVTAYVVSPDVPGLIVACIGDRAGNQSDSPMGSATLWRTRDGGAHWQPLGIHAFRAGCELALPRGGHGTLFAYNLFAPTPDQDYLMVSHNAGDTWQTVYTDTGDGTGPDLARARYDAIAAGVYRDGTLYTATLPTAPSDDAGSLVFAASHDDGRTWTAVESAPDALVHQGFAPRAIAPDYSAPHAWLRLLAPGYGIPNVQPPNSPAIVQRSDDNGRTWRTVAPIGPAASDFEAIGDSATLLTSPTHPGRVCALLEPIGTGLADSGEVGMHPAAEWGASAPSARAPAFAGRDDLPTRAPALGGRGADILQSRGTVTFAGPPPPIPHRTVLAASDDGGAVWSAWVIGQHQRDYGGAVWPGLALDAHGDCYVADQTAQVGASAQNTMTVYRAADGGGHPVVVASLSGQSASLFAVSSAGGDAIEPRLFVLATVYTGSQMIVCQGNVCPPEPPLQRPHLIWTSPAAS